MDCFVKAWQGAEQLCQGRARCGVEQTSDGSVLMAGQRHGRVLNISAVARWGVTMLCKGEVRRCIDCNGKVVYCTELIW